MSVHKNKNVHVGENVHEDGKLLGDHIEDAIKATKIDLLQKAIAKMLKHKCNCEGRKQKLNELHKKLKELLGES